MEFSVCYGGHGVTMAAGAGGASQWAVWTLRPLLEEVQQAFLGEHLHVVLTAAPTKSTALICTRPSKTLLLQLSQTTLSGCFLQLTVRVVLGKEEGGEMFRGRQEDRDSNKFTHLNGYFPVISTWVLLP